TVDDRLANAKNIYGTCDPEMAGQRAQVPARGRVPNPNGAIIAAGDECVAVRAEGERDPVPVVGLALPARLARGRVPQVDTRSGIVRQQSAAVRGELKSTRGLGRYGEAAEPFARGRVPKRERRFGRKGLGPSSGQGAAVRRKGKGLRRSNL